MVDQLIQNNQNINIGNQTIKLRRLHNPDKRIILSNVFPNIPNSPILDQLLKYNIIPTSPISFLRAGSIANGLDHVLSFRRQLFISHDDIEKLPTSMLINYNSANYRIFLSDDTVTCFLCKEKGHTSTSCPTNISKTLTPDTSLMTHPMDLDMETNNTNIIIPIAHQAPPAVNLNDKVLDCYAVNPSDKENPTTPNVSNLQPEKSQTGGIKRPAPPTSSPTSSPPQSPTRTNQPPKSQKNNQIINKKTEENITKIDPKKKLKSSTENFIDWIEEHLSPCKTVLEKTKIYPLITTNLNYL